ncbi:MAG: hypothetical protein J6Y31_04145 [Bacteroidales bacterium]|nr:hypothetical protein [Bacteroidales bacterium]MBP5374089.1 hypothetical protein [Bacteroidales bacterium]
MKRLLTLCAAFLLLGLGLSAQVRSYADNASKAFVIGLDTYFFGAEGSLDFTAGGQSFTASLSNGSVSLASQELENGGGDVLVGIHDFTNNRNPEFVVARRNGETICANVYALSGGKWKAIGRIGATGGKEIRVFRQAFTIRSGEALYTWTWHGSAFDFKASDGSSDPTPAL